MFTATLFTLILSTPVVLAGQIPVIDGVIGGTGNALSLHATKVKAAASSATTNTPGKLRIKSENSGICESTAGAYQATGYGDLSTTDSIWFWYFAARNNPSAAPLTLWLNGGPGTSSMIGLFQELGPCRINNDTSSASNNPFSWNTDSNILFIDQPVGVGYSFAADVQLIGTSKQAAAQVWTFLQIFLSDSRFSNLSTHDFALWTESYGGHYGPVFANYFLSQNAAIASGTIHGIPLRLKVLGIGDGLTDALLQYPGYIDYASSNPYQPLVSSTVITSANSSWTASGGCRDQINACYNGGNNTVCSNAQNYCNARVLSPLYGNYYPYYVSTMFNGSDVNYPADITNYMASIQSKIGAEKTWSETNLNVYLAFAATGDWMRNTRPDLEAVIDAGVRTVVYAGDADYMCNFMGIEAMMASLETQYFTRYQSQAFDNYTVNGQVAGLFKSAGGISYIRFYGSGHEVPAYGYGNLQPGQAALQMFSQIMNNDGLHST